MKCKIIYCHVNYFAMWQRGRVTKWRRNGKKTKIFRRCTKKSIKQKFLSSIICGWIHEWRGNMQISNKNGLFSQIYMPTSQLASPLNHRRVASHCGSKSRICLVIEKSTNLVSFDSPNHNKSIEIKFKYENLKKLEWLKRFLHRI